jgi:hypothetical protein
MYEEDSVKKINKDLVLDQADMMAGTQGYRVLALPAVNLRIFVQRDDYKIEKSPPSDILRTGLFSLTR